MRTRADRSSFRVEKRHSYYAGIKDTYYYRSRKKEMDFLAFTL